MMKIRFRAAVLVCLLVFPCALAAQTLPEVQAHVAKAYKAAGENHRALADAVCHPRVITPEPGKEVQKVGARGILPDTRVAPDYAAWHREPVRVFDNLVFVGQSEFSAWAVITSEGIILIDTIFDYSVEDEIVNGLRKLGFDPATIKYAIVSHGHYDHAGGAKYLQEKFGTRVIMGEADWDLVETRPDMQKWRPKRDMIATDGMKLTLGDTTLTLYLTPGHTQGTISTLIPVTDHGVRHLAAEWGGTMLTFARTPENFETYIASARRFREIALKEGADVVLSNHTDYDGSKSKLPRLDGRKSGEQHPYVVGQAVAGDYLTVVEECARAGLAYLHAQAARVP